MIDMPDYIQPTFFKNTRFENCDENAMAGFITPP